ncbi:MAG: NADPH-dependent oxidoreductase [Oscillochloris sp.]|nr:NADPH-dependent oxidoreductase [Oscillochloris sp.]
MTTVFPSLAELLQARYGEAQAHPETALNEALTTILAHRSVRKYRDQGLPEGTLELLVAAAQSAATSSNLQTWSVVAVEDPAHKAQLAGLAGDQEHIRRAPLLLVWLADLSRLADVAQARDMPYAGLDYFEMFLVAAIDAALAAQNAALAAEALGLGVCYIGAMRNQPLDVAAALGLPPRSFAVFGMTVGYPDPAQPAAVKPRLPQAAVLHRERYQPDQAPAVADYRRRMEQFYADQQMKAADWALHSARRIAGPQTLSGRDKLVAALQALGFPLH